MHVKKSKFVKITCILVFSDNNSFVRKCSICNCEIYTLYTNEMYANERLPVCRLNYQFMWRILNHYTYRGRNARRILEIKVFVDVNIVCISNMNI